MIMSPRVPSRNNTSATPMIEYKYDGFDLFADDFPGCAINLEFIGENNKNWQLCLILPILTDFFNKMEYNYRDIEKKWQEHWKQANAYRVSNDSSKPKCYVLDMFPYPSGAGLHVGHPLGYIASDIYARYKRLKGFNVLHPMGYDAFGLPAEQYAIEHGIHPAVSTKQNIENFRNQLDKIFFSFDWSREVNTSEPSYYKWTQWIFLQLFKSYYDRQTKKAESIESLVRSFEKDGNKYHPVPDAAYKLPVKGDHFTAEQWNSFDEKQQQDILMQYRLAYSGYGEVNWCEALGTV